MVQECWNYRTSVVDLAALWLTLHCETSDNPAQEVSQVCLPKCNYTLMTRFEVICNRKSVMNIQRHHQICNCSGNDGTYQRKLYDNTHPSACHILDFAGIITKHMTLQTTCCENRSALVNVHFCVCPVSSQQINPWFLPYVRRMKNSNLWRQLDLHKSWISAIEVLGPGPPHGSLHDAL